MAKRKKSLKSRNKARTVKKTRINKGPIIILSILLVLFILSLIFDNSIFKLVQETRIASGLSLNLGFIDSYFFYIVLFVISIAFILIDPQIKNKKQWTLSYILGLVFSMLITFLLKWIIARPRPIPSQNFSIDQNSFPSGHTTFAFSLLSFLRNKALFIIWIVISILIAIERIWQGVHYPSDVIAGAIIGYLVPIIITKIIIKIRNKKKR